MYLPVVPFHTHQGGALHVPHLKAPTSKWVSAADQEGLRDYWLLTAT